MKKILLTLLIFVSLNTFTLVSKAQSVGSTITGSYTYYDPEGDLEYGSTFQWYRDGVAISGATNLSYTITNEDLGHGLVFEVTPRSLTGISPGKPIKSQNINIPNPNAYRGGGVLPLPEKDIYSSGSQPKIIFNHSTTSTSSPDKGAKDLDNKANNLLCKTFTSNIVLNSKKNDLGEVKLWQAFLNKELNINLPITGFFGKLTFAAVKKFQLKYKDEILTPLNLKIPTGQIYKATINKANSLIICQN